MRPHRLGAAFFLTILWWAAPALPVRAEPPIGMGELEALIEKHIPKKGRGTDPALLKEYRAEIYVGGESPTTFILPGFESLGCGQCHKPDQLILKSAERMSRTLVRLKKAIPEIQSIPLRQVIIQTYSDALLQPGQLAHATFDTIRISPASILIDSKVYKEETHLHESLHLTQKFLGHVNELEAYGLNIRSDPRFMLLNYPYFAKVLEAFFVPDMSRTLDDWFNRGVREPSPVPREVQWFLGEFDGDALQRLSEAIAKIEPLLKEVSRINREQPLAAAYWSDRTGVPSLMLELAAVKLLPLPELTVTDEIKTWAFGAFDQQFNKDDNTRLGYIINRRDEALMHLKYGKGPKDPAQQLALYFYYLKQRFVDGEGKLKLEVEDQTALPDYVTQKVKGIEAMTALPGFTEVEKAAAHAWIAGIKKELSTLEQGESSR